MERPVSLASQVCECRGWAGLSRSPGGQGVVSPGGDQIGRGSTEPSLESLARGTEAGEPCRTPWQG